MEITSPPDGTLYPLDAPITVPLLATFNDDEHGAGQLSCAWQTTLHHNNHAHSEPSDASCVSSAQISPVGCDGNVYFYTVSLTVSDPLGLAATDTVTLLPDCPNVAPVAVGDSVTVAQGYAVAIDVLANDADAVGAIDPTSVEIVSTPVHGTASVDALTGVVTYAHDGSRRRVTGSRTACATPGAALERRRRLDPCDQPEPSGRDHEPCRTSRPSPAAIS